VSASPATTVAPVPRVPPLPSSAYARMTAVLRGGLTVSLVLLLAALAAYLAENPGATPSSTLASNPIAPYLSPSGLAHGLAAADPSAFLALGLFALIATPVLRVVTGFYYFRQGRERTMTIVTGSVLFLLLLGILVIGPLIH
jgi:uncharacterized membrane protein